MIDYLISKKEIHSINNFPKYLLSSRQLTHENILQVFSKADFLRTIRSYNVPNSTRFISLFNQPSTRTHESFLKAAEYLNISIRSLNDLSLTSLAKGESVSDSTRTLATFYNGFIVRHPEEEFTNQMVQTLAEMNQDHILISAGTGKLEHPTQAILDAYTIRDSFENGLDKKRILLVGDIARNRAARSLAILLSNFNIPVVDFVCVPGYEPDQSIHDSYHSAGIKFNIFHDLEKALRDVGKDIDVIYMTRLQQEWDSDNSKLGTQGSYILNWDYKKYLKNDCKIMHPLPRVNELPVDWDYYSGSLYWKQIQNGFWIRSAIILKMLGY